MSNDRPDPGEFLERAQQMLRELFGSASGTGNPWESVTRPPSDRPATAAERREPSPQQQRENLTFALATRAVEALEDVALNVAAIRQRLERVDGQRPPTRSGSEDRAAGGGDAPDGDAGPSTS